MDSKDFSSGVLRKTEAVVKIPLDLILKMFLSFDQSESLQQVFTRS